MGFPWVFLGFPWSHPLGTEMINTYLLVHEYRSQGGPRSAWLVFRHWKVSGRFLWWDPQNVTDLHGLVKLQKTMERFTMQIFMGKWYLFRLGHLHVRKLWTLTRGEPSKSSSSDDNSENYGMVVSPNEHWTMTIRWSMTESHGDLWTLASGILSHLGRLYPPLLSGSRARVKYSIPISGFSPFLSIKNMHLLQQNPFFNSGLYPTPVFSSWNPPTLLLIHHVFSPGPATRVLADAWTVGFHIQNRSFNVIGTGIDSWLVVWNNFLMTFHSVGNVIIPTDELIFWKIGGLKPPTR